MLQQQIKAIEKAIAADKTAIYKTPTELIATLVGYQRWVINQYVAGNFYQADLPLVEKSLKMYKANKNQLESDIMKYTWHDLQFELANLHTSKRQQDKDYKKMLIDSGQLIEHFRDDNSVVYEPKTYEASVYASRGTQWCVGSKTEVGKVYFKKYTTGLLGGQLLLLFHQTERYIIQFNILEFSDINDKQLTPRYIADIRKRILAADYLFKSHEQQLLESADPKLLYLYIEAVFRPEDAENPEDIPHTAFTTAAESILSQDPFYALLYAVKMLNSGWPMGEPAINSVERYATAYQRFISTISCN